MILRNRTTFPAFVFETQDQDGDDHHVVVLRGTFRIEQGRLVPVPYVEQGPLLLADEYHGDPMTTSVRRESDLAPFKPASDILVDAVAHAPGGEPQRSWLVGLKVGRIVKRLRVTGPRHWSHDPIRGWRLSEPEPCTSLPLRYEYAFGGRSHDREGHEERYELNPVGLGFLGSAGRRDRSSLPAPRIESPEDPIGSPNRAYVPAGFGPIARHWEPRRSRCGTIDERWVRERWPRLPDDFDFAVYNAAPADQTVPTFLQGDETVVLEGLDPQGTLRFALPGFRPTLEAVDKDDYRVHPRLMLDTLAVDVPKRIATLVWRATFLRQQRLRSVKLGLDLPATTAAAGVRHG